MALWRLHFLSPSPQPVPRTRGMNKMKIYNNITLQESKSKLLAFSPNFASVKFYKAKFSKYYYISKHVLSFSENARHCIWRNQFVIHAAGRIMPSWNEIKIRCLNVALFYIKASGTHLLMPYHRTVFGLLNNNNSKKKENKNKKEEEEEKKNNNNKKNSLKSQFQVIRLWFIFQAFPLRC